MSSNTQLLIEEAYEELDLATTNDQRMYWWVRLDNLLAQLAQEATA